MRRGRTPLATPPHAHAPDRGEPDVDEPDELGQTGPAGLALTALTGVLLTAIGTMTVLLVRQARRDPATTPTKETP